MIKISRKEVSKKLSTHIHQKEFDCKCKNKDCIYTLYHPFLIDMFEDFRNKIGGPLIITSGYRCQKHNSDPFVGGKDGSKHTLGCAMDIACPSDVCFETFVRQANLCFNLSAVRIKPYFGQNFIHVQIDP